MEYTGKWYDNELNWVNHGNCSKKVYDLWSEFASKHNAVAGAIEQLCILIEKIKLNSVIEWQK